MAGPTLDIHFADNRAVLSDLPDASFELIYIDPPFNTGRSQARTTIEAVRDDAVGDRTGFGGRRYRSVELGSSAYADRFDDDLAYLEPRLVEGACRPR